LLFSVKVKGVEQALAARRASLVEKLRRDRSLSSPATEAALLSVPREEFIPASLRDRAYDDEPLAIGADQTISAPHMVAIMTDALDVLPGQRILEVGTGSGYQAAVLARIVGSTGRVVSVERIPALAERARAAIRDAGATNVEVNISDGSVGHERDAPYDRIIVTASAPDVPPPLLDQLAPQGILLIPIGGRECELVRIRKTTTGFTRETLGACAFVPLLGRHGQPSGPVVQ
jgi:protein-L-isoaspartate(D-aspartate) O-methyltransferase